jgi:hypothetical protein
MADYTKYLRLIKPGGNDYYNIDDFNQNSELIDKETEKLNNAVTEIKNGATREKAGIVQFGTEEGKALEGMMLARLAGCVGYGGDIQEAGVKDVNYIYYDRNTRKMYKCLNQNSDVSANVANFIPLDNNSLLDRLENLIKYDFIDKTAGTRYSTLVFSKIGNIGHVFLDVPSSVSTSLNDGTLLFTFPIGYKPKIFNLKLIVSNPGGRTARTRYDANTGNLYILSKLDVAESMYLDTFYFLD